MALIHLSAYGFQGDEREADGLIPARITEERRGLFKAVCAHGEVDAVLSGAYYHGTRTRGEFPAVGDFVRIRHNPSGSAAIVSLLPRKSKFSRTNFSGHAVGYVKTVLEQVVASNFDSVFILSSLNRDFNVARIARYLTQARQSGGEPVVVLTKADLCESFDAQIEAVRRVAADVDIVAVSSHTGLGLDALGRHLAPGKTVVCLGMSGVGKSSLLNALAGETLMAVREIREDDARGRHTTTHRQLVMLPSGALFIDTPGMRELGLWDAGDGVSLSFPNIEALFTRCRFADCRHDTEPGCAVRAALEDGSLPQAQWDSYLAQQREVKFVESKTEYLKSKRMTTKAIAKFAKEYNSRRDR